MPASSPTSPPHTAAGPSNGQPHRGQGPEPPPDPSQLPTTESLRDTIRTLRRLQQEGKTLHDVRQSHTAFARQYPKLVQTVMQPGLDETQLEFLLQMFDKVKRETVSYTQASHEIGDTMFNQYIAPRLTPAQRATVNARVGALKHATPEELARAASAMTNMPNGPPQ